MSMLLKFFQLKSKDKADKSVIDLFHMSVTEAEIRSALHKDNVHSCIMKHGQPLTTYVVAMYIPLSV